MSEPSSCSNYGVAECFPEKYSWCQNEVCHWLKCEVFDGQDTALFKIIPLTSALLTYYQPRAQDYKEKEKLDSKQISNSTC